MSTDVDINAIMERWRLGVKRKQRGLASFMERIEMRMGAIRDRIATDREVLDDWEIRRVRFTALGHYEDVDTDWQPIKLGDTWGEEGMSAFWRRRAEMPRRFAGKKVELRIYVGGDALLTVNGEPYHGLDPFHHEVPLADEAAGDELYDLAIESYIAWHAEKAYPHPFALAELVTIDPDVRRAYWDLRCVIKALDIPDIDEKLRTFLSERLWDALKRVPLQPESDAALREAILAAADQVQETIYADDSFSGAGLQHLVGHSHLDVVFMWPYREFVRKVGRTHATMLRLMEAYPEFTFSQSQAKLYADMKEHWPALYEQVKKRVAEGRWELTGAFWVEPDCNLISGESFVRQILYGQKFFEEEFGVRARSCWQPDVFGLSWAMPQILAKSGIDYFLTNKMAIWNDTNPWTHHTFWWEGMDGSRVFSIVPPGHFIGTVDPDIMDRQWRTFTQKETVGETLHVYGWGDGGGGPDAAMVESGRRYADFPGLVPTRFSTAEESFESLRRAAEGEEIPVLADEIYLEAHRGTYTTKGELKKSNRRMEYLYREAEALAAFAAAEGAEYPEDRLRKGWEDLLTSQFHDSLPGTHVNEAYHELLADYDRIREIGEAVLDEARGRLAAPAAEAGDRVVVWNPLLGDRDDVLAVRPSDLAGRAVADNEGEPLPTQTVTDLAGGETTLACVEGVPSVGYRTVDLVEAASDAQPIDPELKAAGQVLENSLLRAEFNETGELVRLYDKEHDREVIDADDVGNRFRLYEDTPGKYEAWDIAATYVDHEVELSREGSVTVDETGPIRASLMIERPIADSKLRQRVALYAGRRELVFETEIDWVERQRLLKVGFPVTVKAREATYDIAYGNMSRATHRNTPYDAAKFEVPAHEWMDLSQADYGVSLMNDGKYGHETYGSTIRLTLLKGSIYPDPEADKGLNRFTYVLMPHAGDWRQAGTLERARRLNAPLEGRLAAEPPEAETRGFVACDAPGMTLEAVKRAEDGRGIIVRLVEQFGGTARGRLTFERPVARARSADLMENDEAEIAVDDGAVPIEAGPYEIVTLRVELT